jgi:hypothetical protein
MRLILSLCALLAGAAALMPGAALAQAAAPGGPPTSGWAPPPGSGAAPKAAPHSAPAPPTSGWSAPGAASPAAPAPGGWSGADSQRDCGREFLPLREEAEKKAAAIKAAAATKKQPVVCQAFKNFAAAEAKVVKYVEEHGAECRIPPEVLKTIKGNHSKTLEIRTKVCDVAAAPTPRAPSLSDALGTSRIPTISSNTPAKKTGSTFDTLTGNPLSR